MPGHYCFVCASNEGVFLDVTPENRDAFGDQVEACLSTKINDIIDLSNKICYKCAYELDHCTKFVQKYRKSHEPEARKVDGEKTSTPCCFLCYELTESDRIFDLAKDNSVLFNPLRKIRTIFNDEVGKNGESKLICLTCRYNLDVLYDLKRVYQETIANLKALINKEINYSNFPKVHTDVVNRKTTITTFPDITFYGSINSDSDSNEESMARSSKRRGKGRRSDAQTKLQDVKSKVRNCDKCHSTVANGIDMYRFHRTGLTVCKNCWITMDPNDKPQRRRRQIQSNLAETKLCAVFLTDVKLSKELCKEKTHEEDKNKSSTLYDSSQDETKSSGSSPRSVSSRTKNHIVNGKARQGRKRRIDVEKPKDDDVERTPSKMAKINRESANASETKSVTVSVDSAGPSSSTQSVRKRGSKKKITVDRSSDSDGSLEQKETRSNIKLNDHVNKTSSRKRQKVEEKTLNTRTDSSDEMSDEESMSLKSRITGVTRLSSTTKSEKERSIGARTRSSSRSSTEMAPPTEFKSPKSSPQSETKTEYTCDLCNKKFDTKLSNSQHKLTHLKQASLKLKKITVPTIKEKSEAEVNSQDDESSKEVTSHRSKKTASNDRHIDDPSEDIAINIDDDSDDEEVVSLSERLTEKKEMKKEACDEDGDKPDVSKSESHVEEESANDGNSETKEFEQCEEPTVKTNETIEDNESSRNKEERDKCTTDEDKISTSRDNDNSKDEATETTVAVSEERNVDEAENKDIENETESFSAGKETTINKCNNRDNLQEEITLDRETSKSPILLTRKRGKDNKSYSESCKNNLDVNNSDDNEEIIEEPEIIQNDSTNESLKKDTKALEENIRKDLPNNVTETLSERDSDDDIIINQDIILNEVNEVEELEENQQDRSNEESMEVEMIADKFNSVKDIVNADISNGERHDEILDNNDETDVTVVVPVHSDSFDDKVKHKITDKTILTDDSKEQSQLDEEIKELEELVDHNIVNNKHEVHENFTCVSDNSSVYAASEILKEVFDLAAAEVQQREEATTVKNLTDIEMETLENISREIRKSADMPSLDPINMMDIDDDNDITLN